MNTGIKQMNTITYTALQGNSSRYSLLMSL